MIGRTWKDWLLHGSQNTHAHTQIFDQAFHVPEPKGEETPASATTTPAPPATAVTVMQEGPPAALLDARRRHARAFNAAWCVCGWVLVIPTCNSRPLFPPQQCLIHPSTPQRHIHRARRRPGVEQLLRWSHQLGRPLRWFVTLGSRVAAMLDEEHPLLTLVRSFLNVSVSSPLWSCDLPPHAHTCSIYSDL